MDTRSGKIYPSKDEGVSDLMAKGVARAEAESRLVTGTVRSLKKFRKLIRKELRREAERRSSAG